VALSCIGEGNFFWIILMDGKFGCLAAWLLALLLFVASSPTTIEVLVPYLLNWFAGWLHSVNITVLCRSFGADGHFAFLLPRNFAWNDLVLFSFLSRFVLVAVLI
jgi:hypothetical protein